MVGRKTSLREHPLLAFLRMKQEQKEQVPSHAKENHKRLD